MHTVFATDIHLDHALRREVTQTIRSLVASLLAEHPDTAPVVLTGDLSIAAQLPACLRAFGETGREVHFVLGNHDFWGSSFARTRESIQFALEMYPNLHYPTLQGPRHQGSWTVVGHDGWYDHCYSGEEGGMHCRQYIEDFHETAWNADMYIRQLRDLGAQSAKELQGQLQALGPEDTKILVLTHVPPWIEILQQRDLPQFYVNRHMGVFLKDWALAHPNVEIKVLCGHSHMGSGGPVEIAPNLQALCGRAAYKYPRAETLDLSML